MSLSDIAESPSAPLDETPTPSTASDEAIFLHIPRPLLVLPSVALSFGLSIGFVRGGSQARLRFLAENAHRMPKTVGGWYFYTKTRNYRVIQGALKSGGYYGAALGGSTLTYVLLDESLGWAREQIFGVKIGEGGQEEREQIQREIVEGRRIGWRKGEVEWEDGAGAGGLMGLAVGLGSKLPKPLFIRSLVLGCVLGALTSSMQVAQHRIGRLRMEEERISSLAKANEQESALLAVEETSPGTELSPESNKETSIVEDKSWWSSLTGRA
ncbi:hypothetical protein L202_03789 [Cryptococcus amylolentus CBS 6039]|uniref:Uncharacterized protein n=2 Tax=Cryptococcus amylolentus TaxID=104669 RepID=A0A1E3HUA0_9TREE|nr:hypothetical protein L202_03789 [Cryptococcus amylolentus CBS 6039]ODN79900.1 hypothetical protein L202_03789 [Cryptococcus amylolentus CBS 6039]ODO08159.1 hypothetical protein I350_03748 [Cryptococcus amylolentus CBS 6273]